jgi:hypothetical protein
MTVGPFNRGDVAAHGSGGGFLYRPNELLVASEDLSLISPQLEPFKPQMNVVEELDVVQFLLPTEVSVPELVDRLRRVEDGRSIPQVGPNHVLIGQEEEEEAGEPLEDGPYSRGLLGPLVQTSPVEIDLANAEPLVGIEIGVVDGPLRSNPLIQQLIIDGNIFVAEQQAQFGPGDDLDANHAIAVVGVLVQGIPRTTIRLEAALDATAVGDELGVAQAMLRLRDTMDPRNRQVLLLPIGGYSCGDMEPVALSAAAARLPANAAVVAAAGNAGRDRPFWPAALDRVVGVGASDRHGRQAPFSNGSPSATVWAAGVGVPTTAGLQSGRTDWVRLSGTSLAAARFSADLARRMAERDLDWRPAVDTFLDEAGAAQAVGPSSQSGAGLSSPAEATTTPEPDAKPGPPAPARDATTPKTEKPDVLAHEAPPPAPTSRVGEREVQVVGYDADGILEQEDRLDILDDVHTLAAVLAASATTPPLSVGLFGDWGSGKSFFMRQLRLRIDKLANQSRRAALAQSPTFFCSEVVQIEFNAWHYIDANLWASLVTRIFEGLSQHLAEQKEASEAYRALLGELETARVLLKQAEGRRQAAETALAQAKQTKADLRTERQGDGDGRTLQDFVEQNPELGEAADQLVETLGIDRQDLQLTELRRVTEDLRHVAGRLRRGWNALDRTEGFWSKPRLGAILAAAAVVAVLGLRWLVSTNADVKGLVALVGSTFAALASVAASIGRTARQALTAAAQVVDKEDQDHNRQLAAAQQQVDQAQQEMDAAQGEVERVQQLDAGTVYRFIEDRYTSSDYRQYLGIVALIQRDFQNLSDRLKPSDGATSKGGSGLPQIDRIVLYIDDLDRCPSDRVVQVLQAVHLLLAFPLFVVVVGVDSRWLLRSLRKEYAAMLMVTDKESGHSEDEQPYWASTPQNYLEKIFQIPYWIRPMEKQGYVKLIRSLFASDARAQVIAPSVENSAIDGAPEDRARAGDRAALGGPPLPTVIPPTVVGSPLADEAAAAEEAPAARPSPSTTKSSTSTGPSISHPASGPSEGPPPGPATTGATREVDQATESGAKGGDNQGESGAVGAAAAERKGSRTGAVVGRLDGPAEKQTHAASPQDPDIDLTPARLIIGPDEQAFIETLAPLIPTPRVAKRLVNTYRLLRVSVPDHDAFEGRGETGQYQAALLLLAIMTGFPTQAGRLFQHLAQSGHGTWSQFVDGVRPVRNGSDQPDSGESDYPPDAPDFTSRLLGDLNAVEGGTWLRLCERLDEVRPHLQLTSLTNFQTWVEPVARYSFEAGRVVGRAGQWSAPADGETPA